MRPATPRRSFARAIARGYTVVEVLLSMTVLAIGASAVMSMQKAALQGNLDARKTDMANSIARMWVERVRRDATQWTLPSPVNPSGNNFASAQLLQYVGTGWVLPTAYSGQTPPVSPSLTPSNEASPIVSEKNQKYRPMPKAARYIGLR